MARPAIDQGGAGGCPGFRTGGATRREALRAGALTLGALGLPEYFAGRAAATTTPGRAKSCILIFQWGGPSHLDTWDPKPDAPDAIRGPFQAIATKTPGLLVGEHFPMIAQRTDRLAVIRSMSHDDPAHLSSAHRVLTGHLAPRPFSDNDGPSPADWPNLGALVAKVRPTGGALPGSVIMPWIVSHPAAPGGRAPGQHGGWLGKTVDPFRVEGDPNTPGFRVPGLGLPEGVAPDRLRSRRDLLAHSGDLDGLGERGASAFGPLRAKALDALVSAEARGAFEIDREDPRLRDRYGRHIHGQCLLLARRLVEAGVPLVTVNWHDDGQAFWDTHGNNFESLKNRLMPPADRGFAALIDDLEARGLLDETLVVWVGEFGRAPRITPGPNGGGREHWPRCYSAALAGGGVRGGTIYGGSDRWASYPTSDPVGPDDLGATILYALGIDPATEVRDPVGRPLPINNGRPITALFG